MLQVVLWALLALPVAENATRDDRPRPKAAQPSQQKSRATTGSPHGPTLNLPCENCHSATAWRPIKANPEFDHDKTKYPLRGMHEKVECTQCHVKPVFTNAGKNCQDCHTDVHQRKMGTNCAQCHTVQGWNTAVQQVKEHQNRFPLLGAHAAVQCEDCHKGAAVGQFKGLSTACVSCHRADFQKTTNPNHVTSQFPQNCQMCHTFDSWIGATFNHAGPPANFPLTGAHATIACTTCHINNNYNLTTPPNACGNSGCHLTTWQQTTNPKHSAAPTVFPVANCSTCHITTTWTTATFDHSTTGFPLTNSHQLAPAGKVTACTDCHINNNYNLTTPPNACGNSGCHLTTWQQTTNPNHAAAPTVFPVANCSTCHTTTTWTTATFDHSTTGFPLTNSHQLAPAGKVTACTDCHINNNYNLTTPPNACGNSGCHLTTWQQTTNPVHSSAGAPFAAANCSTCHNTIAWTTAAFDHSTTGWPLTGSHQMSPAGKVNACTDCHVSNNYTFTSANTDCYGCHKTAWQSTTTLGGSVPNHVAANFPTPMCLSCHDTVLWSDGKFDHSTTGFPLQGPHMLPPRSTVTGAIGAMVNACTDCHMGGNYTTGYPTTDCYGCHQTYFINAQAYGTNVPNHVAASYPTTCITCHTTWVTTAWLGAVFNHTFFRIPHYGSVCTDCHIVSTDYKQFSCENCHTQPAAHRPGMSHPSVCSPSPSCWYTPPTKCYNCHKG
ncbi:MAG: hypothetical protein DMG41_19595 [Acidobacteria bacterium]|nr:MAG: hypothetical protein DMG41_19595 [Acidobacteriota bacterium]